MDVVSIFPTPVSRSKWDNTLSKDQMDWILSRSRHTGTSHAISDDTHVLENEVMSNLNNWIMSQVRAYYDAVLSTDAEPFITQSWINYSDSGMYTHPHSHPNSIVSGVYYVVANDVLHLHSSSGFNYQFNKELTDWNANRYNVNTEPNLLIMFPSHVMHSVDQHKGYQRISIAFNTFARGSFGKEEHLTHLEI